MAFQKPGWDMYIPRSTQTWEWGQENAGPPPTCRECDLGGRRGGGQCCSLDIVSLLTALNTHLNLLNSTLLQEEKDFFLTLLFLCSRSVQRGHREENILLEQTDFQLFEHLQVVRVWCGATQMPVFPRILCFLWFHVVHAFWFTQFLMGMCIGPG